MERTPLYDEHQARGAKIVDFNGWALPIQFGGIVKEHLHTRAQVSVFDCSHMAEYTVHGADAIDAYSRQIISDVAKIPVGKCRYGALLTESGGILDDLITFRMGDDELYVVTNAGPMDKVTDRLCGCHGNVAHVSYETAKIDVQGPAARDTVLKIGFDVARDLRYFHAVWTEWEGSRVLFSRTGYTGELGYEIFMENSLAVKLWNRLLDLEDVEPAGLGARDTLRTEVGYGLSGQDFDESVTPLDAGMESFIGWDTEFVGKDALSRKRDAGDYQAFVGLQSPDRRAPRHGFEITGNGQPAGIVTSGTFGPSVGCGIGLGRVDRQYAKAGSSVHAGPREIPLQVADIPFYKKGTCRAKI